MICSVIILDTAQTLYDNLLLNHFVFACNNNNNNINNYTIPHIVTIIPDNIRYAPRVVY